MQPLTLSQLNSLVRQAIELTLPDSFWVQAELASVRENRGHCYMELIEKAPPLNHLNLSNCSVPSSARLRTYGAQEGAIVAQARACCWKGTWLHIGHKFERETGSPLHAGMKVLLSVRANFHEAYGFSWIVDDIDPTFTLGDMARRRQEILRTLKEEGVIDLNKQLTISPYCQDIAVISSSTAAGYGDFVNQLLNNEYGFQFHIRLFPALMQGDQVESSIIATLNEIYKTRETFDAVVIIRGGGSTTDLSGFDTLALAENVANFPLPVITGIGHNRDQSVLDVVACVSVKTPTAVAAFLIDNLAQTLESLEECAGRITGNVHNVMESERVRLQRLEQQLGSSFVLRKVREENRLSTLNSHLSTLFQQRLLKEQSRVALLEQRVESVDPIHILQRGYSITLHNGYSVKDGTSLTNGDDVTIMFAKGVVNATVVSN